MAYLRSLPAVLVAAAAACGTAPQTPVPISGTATDVAALTGRWEGSYSNPATGRSGSISFSLTANGDSATGDVVMIPRGFGRPLQAWNRATPAGATPPRPSVLTISFVQVARGRVSGSLAPYADPETGEELFTAFEGRLQGDVIEGTFRTHPAGGSETREGQWRVTRRPAE